MASCWQVGWNSKIIKKTISFYRFLRPSAFQLRSKIEQTPFPQPSKIDQKINQNLDATFARFLSQLGSILGRFWEPSWSQVGTKLLQKSIQKIIEKMITFWIASRSIFDRFGLPTSTPTGVIRNGFGSSSGDLGPSWGQDGPKTSPRGPWDRFLTNFA